MVRAKTSNGDAFQPNPNAYVKHRMLPGDGERFETWDGEQGPDMVPLSILKLAERDIELHLMPRQGGWVAQLRDGAREAEGLPFLLTGWSSDPWTALKVVLWKHFSEAGEDWGTLMVMSDNTERYR